MLTSKDFTLSRVAFISQDALIQDAVKEMISRGISSILVCNPQDEVVGILTERDVVWKFTLLDVQDKLTHRVNTVMSRPVRCARLSSLLDDVIDLHLKYKIRHFPVVDGDGQARKQTVIGIVSVTDIARVMLLRRLAEQSRSKTQADSKAHPSRDLALIAYADETFELYEKLFGVLDYKIFRIQDSRVFNLPPELSETTQTASLPMLFDLDGWPVARLREMIPVVQKRFSPLLMATSDPRLLTGFKQFIKDARQEVVIKPLDISYCDWLLTQRLQA